MPRTISPATLQELNAFTEGAEFPAVLLEIDQADLSDPIRVVNNTQSMVSNGETYEAFPFRFIWPSDQDQASRAQLAIDNVGPDIMRWLELSRGAPGTTVVARVVSRATPDVVEAEVMMDLQNIQANRFSITGTLAFRDIINQPGVPFTYDPFNTPPVF